MGEITNFLFSEYTRDGYAVIGTAICPVKYRDLSESEIKDKIRKLEIKAVDDPFYIDYILALYVSKTFPEYLYAVGLSIYVPGIKGPTGGIIGNPFQDISSASGISEDAGNGLSVAAYPGGPGIVIKGTPITAEKIIKEVNPGDGGTETLLNMLQTAMNFHVNFAIAITDGTGSADNGAAAVLNNGNIKFRTIG